jgi:hypothetical protein
MSNPSLTRQAVRYVLCHYVTHILQAVRYVYVTPVTHLHAGDLMSTEHDLVGVQSGTFFPAQEFRGRFCIKRLHLQRKYRSGYNKIK